jgi:hypothetical protein
MKLKIKINDDERSRAPPASANDSGLAAAVTRNLSRFSRGIRTGRPLDYFDLGKYIPTFRTPARARRKVQMHARARLSPQVRPLLRAHLAWLKAALMAQLRRRGGG